MNLLRKILFPVVPVYYLITWLRNRLYDLGIKKSTSFSIPIICVGNLSVGGTGKTPMIEYLVRLLKDDAKIATLSRGYKRKTEGFQLAKSTSTSEDLGDEPFQFYNKFAANVTVAVDSNRVNGITKLLQLNNAPEIVLLDDAFQHRKVKAGLNIMLTTYSNPFFNDMVLPTGDLREPKSGYKRADIIVVTKCPSNISNIKKEEFLKRIKPTEYQHVFFSTIAYANKVVSKTAEVELNSLTNFTLVTGIANATPLVTFLKSKNLKFQHLNFKDHYEFSPDDISKLESCEVILTTEKDFMRLKQYKALEKRLFYLPITVNILENATFDNLVKRFIKQF
ncbi:tetraacyldisaccharide 4'-kinase [Jejuia pallidilutea]|uniref:Tetraacyldisaccharide 4'-kinase n=1 Tax=Jejuia pallidilutea TaxID=504487 RepID=A0A090VTV4_9FLAO|nr:tetraacyldisaccharide 4'-kinase [Jejuia pallidilutea]GAL68165.1 tetraacyldisaccharide 4'-kinase [Jejuia pallidilutea]GAL71595.1 tetraacyldisaccharide 4'-kinase [Jejuia pallidilutea]GAL89914.1 tetraacyldisaccharide 4'-kinase [Jejuia pallidilutea]